MLDCVGRHRRFWAALVHKLYAAAIYIILGSVVNLCVRTCKAARHMLRTASEYINRPKSLSVGHPNGDGRVVA